MNIQGAVEQRRAIGLAAGLSVLVVLSLSIWQGAKGFSLWDEGFLWYGVQRVLVGEVPIRDFQSYDPGRYYWSAGLMSLFGDSGIMALRRSVAIFQWFGLFIAALLVVLARKSVGWFELLLASLIFALWMFPRHKLFDITIAIAAIGVITAWVANPSSRRSFLTGLSVGVIAFFGRNHGVYFATASLAAMGWLCLDQGSREGAIRRFGYWSLGVVVGYSPMLAMLVFVPGFDAAFSAGILFLFENKSTNLPLPVPWPWLVPFNALPIGESIRGVLAGCFFVATLAFGVTSLLWVCWQKVHGRRVPAALVATACLALPYAHFAFSRADVGHLAQGIFPMLVGAVVLIIHRTSPARYLLLTLLFAASLWSTIVSHPGFNCVFREACVPVTVSADELLMDSQTAADVSLLRELSDRYAPQGRAVMATPFWPGAYALLERRSPTYEIYPLFLRSDEFQRAEIERLRAADPGLVVILDFPLDGREELRYRNTHSMIYRHIIESYDHIPESPNNMYQIYKSRKDGR